MSIEAGERAHEVERMALEEAYHASLVRLYEGFLSELVVGKSEKTSLHALKDRLFDLRRSHIRAMSLMSEIHQL